VNQGRTLAAANVHADDTIHFASPHGFYTGQEVVYSHGAGDSITLSNNTTLADGTYYVIVIDDTTIKLAQNLARATALAQIEIDLSTATGSTNKLRLANKTLSSKDVTVLARTDVETVNLAGNIGLGFFGTSGGAQGIGGALLLIQMSGRATA